MRACYDVTAVEFTAVGTVNILANRYMPLWRGMSTLLSDNISQIFAQLAITVYKLFGV